MRSALLALAASLSLSFSLRRNLLRQSFSLSSQQPAAAPNPAASVPARRPDDVKSIDSILAALNGAISGPAGERDYASLPIRREAGSWLVRIHSFMARRTPSVGTA